MGGPNLDILPDDLILLHLLPFIYSPSPADQPHVFPDKRDLVSLSCTCRSLRTALLDILFSHTSTRWFRAALKEGRGDAVRLIRTLVFVPDTPEPSPKAPPLDTAVAMPLLQSVVLTRPSDLAQLPNPTSTLTNLHLTLTKLSPSFLRPHHAPPTLTTLHIHIAPSDVRNRYAFHHAHAMSDLTSALSALLSPSLRTLSLRILYNRLLGLTPRLPLERCPKLKHLTLDYLPRGGGLDACPEIEHVDVREYLELPDAYELVHSLRGKPVRTLKINLRGTEVRLAEEIVAALPDVEVLGLGPQYYADWKGDVALYASALSPLTLLHTLFLALPLDHAARDLQPLWPADYPLSEPIGVWFERRTQRYARATRLFADACPALRTLTWRREAVQGMSAESVGEYQDSIWEVQCEGEGVVVRQVETRLVGSWRTTERI